MTLPENIMLNPTLKKRLETVPNMGFLGLSSFREEVATSLLDTQTKCYCYEIIEERMNALDISGALIENDDALSNSDFDFGE